MDSTRAPLDPSMWGGTLPPRGGASGQSLPNLEGLTISSGANYPGPLETGPLPYGSLSGMNQISMQQYNTGSYGQLQGPQGGDPQGLMGGQQSAFSQQYQQQNWGQQSQYDPRSGSMNAGGMRQGSGGQQHSQAGYMMQFGQGAGGQGSDSQAGLRQLSAGFFSGGGMQGPNEEDIFLAATGGLDLEDDGTGRNTRTTWPGSLGVPPPQSMYQGNLSAGMPGPNPGSAADLLGMGRQGAFAGLGAKGPYGFLPNPTTGLSPGNTWADDPLAGSPGHGLALPRVGSHSSISSLGTSPAIGPSGLFGEHPMGEHPSRTLFVRNISSQVEEEELRQLFGQQGEIRSVYMACKNRGFVMISYYDIRAAKAAMKTLQGYVLRKRRFDIHYSIPKENPTDRDLNQGTLVVFNLPPEVTNEELLELFSRYGEVKEVRETPNKRHHKFIEYYDLRAAALALKALNRTEIAGKVIKIEPSRPGGLRRNVVGPLTGGLGLPGLPGQGLDPAAASLALGQSSQDRAFALGMQQRSKSSSDLVTGGPGGPFSAGNSSGANLSDAGPSAAMLNMLGGGGGHGQQGGGYSGPVAGPLTRAYESAPDIAMLWNQVMAAGGGAAPQVQQALRAAASASSLHGQSGNSAAGSFAAALASNPDLIRAMQQSASSSSLGPLADVEEGEEEGYGAGGSWHGGRTRASAGIEAFPRGQDMMRLAGPSGSSSGHNGPGGSGSGRSEVGGGPSHGGPSGAMAFSPEAAGGYRGSVSLAEALAAAAAAAAGAVDPSPDARGGLGSDPANAVDVPRVLRGEDPRTTLMIRNIPNKYTRKLLLAHLDERLWGAYDFFYLPIDFRNQCNVGYAFINMASPAHVPAIVEALHNKRWARFNSDKVCQVCYARIQGRDALVRHFRGSSLLHEDAAFRPVILDHGETEPLTEEDAAVSGGGQPAPAAENEAGGRPAASDAASDPSAPAGGAGATTG